MLITIHPNCFLVDKATSEKYILNRTKKLGIEVTEVNIEFAVRFDRTGIPTDWFAPHYTHRLLVADIPTFEKFIELIRLFTQDGYVQIKGYTNHHYEWVENKYTENASELMNEADAKYYDLPCLDVEPRIGVCIEGDNEQ